MFILLVLMMLATACSDTVDNTSDNTTATGDAVTVVLDASVDTSTDVEVLEASEGDVVLADEVTTDVLEEEEVVDPEETELDSDPTEFPDSDGSGDPMDSFPSDPIP